MDTDQRDPVVLVQEAHYRFTDDDPLAPEQFEAAKEPMHKALASFCGMVDAEGAEGVWVALAKLDDEAVRYMLPAIAAHVEGEELRYFALVGLLKLAEVVQATQTE